MMAFFRKYLPMGVVVRILPWFISLAILGLFDFVNLTFDINRITDPEYISEILLMLMLSIFIFSNAVYRRSLELKKEDEATRTLEKSCYDTLKQNDTSNMIGFVRVENLERREVAYRNFMRKQKEKLLSKASQKDLEVFDKGTELEKKANKFCRKMQELDYLLDEDYIKRNREYLFVKYPKITINFIQSGFQRNTQDENQENPSRPILIGIKDNWFNFLTPIAVVAFILSMLFSVSDQPTIIALTTIAIKVGLLIVQHYSGSFYALRWLSLTWVADTNLRYNLLLRYIKWSKNSNTKEVPGNEQ